VNTLLSDLNAQKVSDIGAPSADYGHDDLAQTVGDFCSRWELGVEHLATDAQQVAGRLSLSVQAYMQVDQAATGMFDGIVQRSTGADPGAQ
jgi:hypothetical protein